MNYGTLTGPKSEKGSIRSWINYDPLDVEGVLLDAQAYLYGRLRVREMKAGASIAITQGSATAPLPENFLDPLVFLHADGMPIDPRDEREILSSRMALQGEESTPLAYGVFDELIQFDALADESSTAQMLYFKRPALLSRTNQTNFLTTRYPNLLRTCCLMHGADQMQDTAEYSRWKQRTDELASAVSIETDLMARGRDYSVSVR